MHTSDSTPTKTCSKCGIEYPATNEYFRVEKRNRCGLYSWCRFCARAAHATYRSNPEVSERRREYDRVRLSVEETRQKKREYDQERRKRPEVRKHETELQRERQQTPEGRAASKAYHARRKQRAKSTQHPFTPTDVRVQYQSQKGLCWWCSKPVGDNYHVDHRIPLDRGGSNEATNIVVACPNCNLRKHTKLPQEFNGRLL